MFDDPSVGLREDRIVEGEQGWLAIGAVSAAPLLVVHIYGKHENHDGEEILRIIPAREAHQRERRIDLQQAAE
ncbi:MAG TPA: BrnT family toxin [Terriglobia bacterium]|nr:BrnT family toxin [Terriglobia bacterium]